MSLFGSIIFVSFILSPLSNLLNFSLFFLECSDAEILALRAKLRIMQEEMEQVSSDYYKKVLLYLSLVMSHLSSLANM